MNPIEYLKHQGFKVTSDPNLYQSKIFGLRNYSLNGINYDNYCQGYHRAYDLVKSDGAKIPAVMSGVVVAGTKVNGNFGTTVVIANKTLNRQVIYGHLKTNLEVKVGQKITVGETIGFQGNTNYYNQPMASHLHIQFQKYAYLKEHDFVCTGIDCKDLNVMKDNIKGIFVSSAEINKRTKMTKKSPSIGRVPIGFTEKFNRITEKEGYYWLEVAKGKEKYYIAIGDNKNIWGKIKML